MTDDELKAILEKCDHNDNESYMESCFDVSDDARALVAEARRLRGLIATARGAVYGWCCWCNQYVNGVGDPDKHPNCPAFTESGEVK